MNEQHLHFRASGTGGRLDHQLVEHAPEHSRNRLQQLIRQGKVTVNGETVTKTGFRLEGGELVEVVIPATAVTDLRPEVIPLDVVYEDTDVLIVNKAAGMVVHPSPGHRAGTLVNAALAHAPDIQGVGGELRPGVVHRLDKDTSGLVVLAKHDQALRMLQQQFKQRAVEKVYLGLVDGKPPTRSGRVDAAIGRGRRYRKRMVVLPEGKGRAAKTAYHTLESFQEHTLLEIRPETGRTHQIRVHMAFLGCPIAGDKVYGRRKATISIRRHFLHAQRLTLTLPSEREPQAFQAAMPDELAAVLDQLRRPY
ncbi:MAG TPA: RluA family pseudouridine synthase [Anaerolineae bacterium]|nr:RluA family pseudouridine synthase [Anaerolineae bacterium]